LSFDDSVTFGQARIHGVVALIAGRAQQQPLLTTCQHPSAPHVTIIRCLTILVLRRAALMLAMQVGRITPDTLPSPDPSVGVFRFLLVPDGAPGCFLNQGNMDIRLLGRRPALSWSSLCCRASSLLRVWRCILVVCFILNHLSWGVLADSDLLWALRGRPKLTK
jgi:hypothetical protein